MTAQHDSAACIQKAVGDAFYDWVNHEVPVSTKDRIEAAVENAFAKWLDVHTDAIITAIAQQSAGKIAP
jgi:hypothetical protein